MRGHELWVQLMSQQEDIGWNRDMQLAYGIWWHAHTCIMYIVQTCQISDMYIFLCIYIYVFYTHAYLTDPEYQSLLFLHFLVFKQLQNVTQNKGGKLNTPWIQLPWNPFAALQFFLTKICILGVTQCQHQHDVFCYLTRCACVFFVVVLQRISVILILSIFFWLTHQNNIPSSNTSLFKRITSSQTFSEFSTLGMPLQYPENA